GILKWQASEAAQGVNFYATVGASDYPLPGKDAQRRQEFFAALTPEFDDIASPLAKLGIHSSLTGEEMSVGHTYRALHGLAEGSQLAGFMILEPLGDYPAPVLLADGRHVEFLLAVPVFGDELDYVAANGVNKLLDRIEELAAPMWNPYRRSIFG